MARFEMIIIDQEVRSVIVHSLSKIFCL